MIFYFFFKSFVLYRSYFFLVMLKMSDFFFKLQSDLAFIVSLCCLYCSIITIKKKESKKKKFEEVIETWS